MIVAGMNIAMIKCAEMSGEAHIREVVAKLREANDNVSNTLKVMYPVAICIKTVGPEVHIGICEEGEDAKIDLETGSQITITFDSAYKDKCNKDFIFVDYGCNLEDAGLKLHSRVLLNRGKIKLKVCELGISDDSAVCDVVIGGAVPSKAVISFPDSFMELSTISEEDSKNIQLAIELQCDILIITHVQTGADIEAVKETLREKNSPIFVCASITDVKGFHNVDEIITAADGISVPRGYVERRPVSWNLYLATKTIIAKCRSVGKPTIVTSKYLSKYNCGTDPLTADVENSVQVVLEGADVFGLGDEVASGPDPVGCIRSFTDTCREANQQVEKQELIDEISTITLKSKNIMNAVNFTAVTLSLRIDAGAIIVLTDTGRDACCLSVLRPISPIIAVTRIGHVARQLHVYKHVYPIQYIKKQKRNPAEELDSHIQFGITYGKYRGFIKAGDPLLLIHDVESGKGMNDTIRLMFASNANVL